MPTPPDVSIVRIQHGVFQEAIRLNPRFSTGHPLLLTTLDIDWNPPDPHAAISALERDLLAFSPEFARHECRGEGIYHVFSGTSRRRSGRGQTSQFPTGHGGSERFEETLALAHLIEHAVIDFQACVTGASRCSGITAAHRRTPGRFDLMVECREPEVGRCCLHLAVAWLSGALRGESPGPGERDVLEVLRLSLTFGSATFFSPEVAKELGWTEARSERALETLLEAEYLADVSWTVNLSGCSGYRIAGKENPASPRPQEAGSAPR